MAQHKKRLWPVWLVGGALILLIGVWLVQSLLARPNAEPEGTKASVTELDVRPQVITTNDALTRYVQGLTVGDSASVREEDVYYAKDIDWNNESVVAIKVMLFNTTSITSAGIEAVEGKDSYVIDALDGPNCGASIQVDTMRVVLIKQSSRDVDLPVILRTTPNTATCSLQ